MHIRRLALSLDHARLTCLRDGLLLLVSERATTLIAAVEHGAPDRTYIAALTRELGAAGALFSTLPAQTHSRTTAHLTRPRGQVAAAALSVCAEVRGRQAQSAAMEGRLGPAQRAGEAKAAALDTLHILSRLANQHGWQLL